MSEGPRYDAGNFVARRDEGAGAIGTRGHGKGMRRWIDIPPVWLAVFLALAWLQADRLPLGGAGWPVWDLLGGLCVGGGGLLMALAVLELRRARTTVIPHRDAEALVTTGIFRRTRNPIYLGDALILAGMVCYWAAWPSLLLVPLFVWLITDRFILDEESRLEARFGRAFETYATRTPRWLSWRRRAGMNEGKGGRG